MKNNIKKLALTIVTVIALVGITYGLGAAVNHFVPEAKACNGVGACD